MRSREVRSREVRSKEVRSKEARSREVRSSEDHSREVRSSEVRFSEVRFIEEITKIEPASPTGGKEYVDLHLKWGEKGTERQRYACKTRAFKVKPTA